MSYIRWGTPLGLSYAAATGEADPMDGYVAWHRLGPEQRQTEADRQSAALSTWYIYWDASSDDELGRNGQLLAVWHTANREHPLMDYQELRSIADHDAWDLIPGFAETTHPLDIASLQNCVREWLADVEKDYPPAEAMSRRQLADYCHTKIRRHLAEFTDGGRDDTVLYALSNTVRMRAISRRAVADHDPDAGYIVGICAEATASVNAAAAQTGIMPLAPVAESENDTAW